MMNFGETEEGGGRTRKKIRRGPRNGNGRVKKRRKKGWKKEEKGGKRLSSSTVDRPDDKVSAVSLKEGKQKEEQEGEEQGRIHGYRSRVRVGRGYF